MKARASYFTSAARPVYPPTFGSDTAPSGMASDTPMLCPQTILGVPAPFGLMITCDADAAADFRRSDGYEASVCG